ncbi:MAG: hypothetical protein Roseis2KO_25980 [Roseivirga sp.]
MKTIQPYLAIFFVLFLIACSDTVPEEAPEPIEGRTEKAAIWVSEQLWLPTTIGILPGTSAEGGTLIQIQANSSFNKGFRRQVTLTLTGDDFSWPPADTLDLLQNEHPRRIEGRYTQFTNNSNTESDFWVAGRFNLGGIKIYSLTEEDGITYAAGEFYINAGNDDMNPVSQAITSIFEDVRVFSSANEMQQHFDRITALEKFND